MLKSINNNHTHVRPKLYDPLLSSEAFTIGSLEFLISISISSNLNNYSNINLSIINLLISVIWFSWSIFICSSVFVTSTYITKFFSNIVKFNSKTYTF